MDRLFPISDLQRLVGYALDASDYCPGDSGRVRPVPDTRTIRYYTTLGLIDRPTEMRGRTAFYGQKQVEQIVAIKRLQAANQTLSDIQAKLVGIDRRRLKKLASVPDDFWDSAESLLDQPDSKPQSKSKPRPKDESEANASDFWATRPKGGVSTGQVTQSINIQLQPGARLVLETAALDSLGNELNEDQLRRLLAAALPLQEELRRQGLHPPPDSSQR